MRYNLYFPLLLILLSSLVASTVAQAPYDGGLQVKHVARADYRLEQGWSIEEQAIEDTIHALMGETIMPSFKTSLSKTSLTQSSSVIHGSIELSNTAKTILHIDSITPLLEGSEASQVSYSKNVPLELHPGETIKCEYTLNKKGAAPSTVSFAYHGQGHVDSEDMIATITTGQLLGTNYETVSVRRNGLNLGRVSKDFSWISSNEVVCTKDTLCHSQSRIVENGLSDADTVTLICKKIQLTLSGQTQGENLHHWSIHKKASADEVLLNLGDSIAINYTVSVTKDSIIAANFTQGNLKISNPSMTPLAASLNLHLKENQTINNESNTDVSIVLLPGTNTFAYEFHSSAKDTSATIVAELSIKGATFHSELKISAPKDTQNIKERYATISIQNTEHDTLWKNIEESSEWTYTHSIKANKDYKKANEKGLVMFPVDSKATILETNQSATAKLLVKQYVPQITQASRASFYRDSQWEVQATAQPEQHDFCGQNTSINYTVTATKQSTDHRLTVDGTLRIYNPSPKDAMHLDILDVLNQENVTFQEANTSETHVVKPQETLELHYSYASEQATEQPENRVILRLNDVQMEHAHIISLHKGDIIEETNASTLIRDNFGLVTPSPLTESTTIVVSRPYDIPEVDPEDFINGEHLETIQNTFTTTQNPDKEAKVRVHLHRYKPLLNKHIKTQLLQSYDWDITKTVSESKINLLAGGEEEVNYRINLEKKQAKPVYVLQGSITLKNPNPNKDLRVKLLEEINGTMVEISGVNEKSYATVPAGTTRTFTYELRSERKPRAGRAITHAECELNTLEKELSFDYDHVTEIGDVENASVSVIDTYNNTIWSDITESSTFEYSQTINSEGISQSDFIDGVYHFSVPSSARIVELDKSDSVNVEVSCYAPVYSQSTHGTYVNSYEWFAVKTSDSTNMTANEGEALNIPFEIAVNAIPSQIHKKLKGSITIYNPHPTQEMQVDLYAYYDLRLLNLSESTVFIAPLSQQSVNYEETVESTNGSYSDIQMYVNDFEFYTSELIEFTPEPKAHNSEVRVEDNMMASILGIVNANDELPVYFAYNVQMTPTYTGEAQTISNTVNLIGTEENIQASSTFDVNLKVVARKGGNMEQNTANSGCTLNADYWRKHQHNSGMYDLKWTNLPDVDEDGTLEYEKEDVFLSGMSYLELLSLPDANDAYISLAKAYATAHLNILAGADQQSVETEMDLAKNLLSEFTSTSAKDKSTIFFATADHLNKYINGLIGPGLCEDSDIKSTQMGNDISQAEIINYSVYPNPSQKEANFSISIQESADIELNVYDSTGTLLEELINERVETDIEKTIHVHFKKEPGKIYFYKIRVNGVSTSGTLIPG